MLGFELKFLQLVMFEDDSTSFSCLIDSKNCIFNFKYLIRYAVEFYKAIVGGHSWVSIVLKNWIDAGSLKFRT